AALGQPSWSGVSGMLAGAVLVILGAVAPWALIRLLPLTELGSTAAGTLRGESLQATQLLSPAAGRAAEAHHLLTAAADEFEPFEPAANPEREAAHAASQRLSGLPGLPSPGAERNQ